MRIGELAKRAGVNIQTVRFYERERLLRAPARSPSGYRSYSEDDLQTLQFIRNAQQLGFTLREIRQLMELHRTLATPAGPAMMNPHDAEQLLTLTKQRLGAIDEKLRMLEGTRSQLTAFVRRYERSRRLTCPASAKRP